MNAMQYDEDEWTEEDARAQEEEDKRLEQRAQKRQMQALEKIFPFYRDKTLDDFQAETDSQIEAVSAVKQYIEALPEMRKTGTGITFVGQNGVGKTHLASVVMKEARIQYAIDCIELDEYINLYLRMFQLSRSDDDEVTSLFDQIAYIEGRSRLGVKGADFLLLDDVGREHESASGWSDDKVFNLLRFRHNRCLPTILTTNVPIEQLEERYTEGMRSFLQEATVIIPMEGEDYRWTKKDS